MSTSKLTESFQFGIRAQLYVLEHTRHKTSDTMADAMDMDIDIDLGEEPDMSQYETEVMNTASEYMNHSHHREADSGEGRTVYR